jgi:UPF0755 protein
LSRAKAVLLWACLTLTLMIAVGASGGYLYVLRWLDQPGPLATETVVYLPRGTGLAGIADRLAEKHVVDRPLFLEIAARLAGRDRRLQAGEYRFTPRMSPSQVLALLESGRTVEHAITIPEGLTTPEVYDTLRAADVLAGDLPPMPPEGSLLPETYLVPRDEPRVTLVERMQRAMRTAVAEVWRGRAPKLPLEGPEQMVILASLIQRESAIPREYPLIAAVFYNRMAKGMRLQTDPTVIFALTRGQGPLGRPLTHADLQVDSAYNTYQNEGLPPGPIANPGREALEAAVHPAKVDYLYFVADGTGGHAFARTLAEHNRNVARWRRIRDAASGATSGG